MTEYEWKPSPVGKPGPMEKDLICQLEALNKHPLVKPMPQLPAGKEPEGLAHLPLDSPRPGVPIMSTPLSDMVSGGASQNAAAQAVPLPRVPEHLRDLSILQVQIPNKKMFDYLAARLSHGSTSVPKVHQWVNDTFGPYNDPASLIWVEEVINRFVRERYEDYDSISDKLYNRAVQDRLVAELANAPKTNDDSQGAKSVGNHGAAEGFGAQTVGSDDNSRQATYTNDLDYGPPLIFDNAKMYAAKEKAAKSKARRAGNKASLPPGGLLFKPLAPSRAASSTSASGNDAPLNTVSPAAYQSQSYDALVNFVEHYIKNRVSVNNSLAINLAPAFTTFAHRIATRVKNAAPGDSAAAINLDVECDAFNRYIEQTFNRHTPDVQGDTVNGAALVNCIVMPRTDEGSSSGYRLVPISSFREHTNPVIINGIKARASDPLPNIPIYRKNESPYAWMGDDLQHVPHDFFLEMTYHIQANFKEAAQFINVNLFVPGHLLRLQSDAAEDSQDQDFPFYFGETLKPDVPTYSVDPAARTYHVAKHQQCIKCDNLYNMATNASGSCIYHPGDSVPFLDGFTHTCCGRDDGDTGCKIGRHAPMIVKNGVKYRAFFPPTRV